ncbi:fumarylacetoacetase [Stackebrandtia nassauensis]|uniref:fumarylacetoacetase n=1 Tax=Stackebrandtia nassauensis (strain DSM 44728 / CIP 108903 / NRRL B-16338 / NBRC 102104 / LLR-40K-21) TaxID=446470 RepID=D3Q5M5_STANL|nr:fumarylacetoacetase [Stackebrandtia nassauensis]ADD46085.1 fumarylacetoacetase [Stackebrandtia nassauensis DSM 44728]
MTWLESAVDSPYGIHHLPYGVFSTTDNPARRLGVRVGDQVLDLKLVVTSGTCANCETCTALSSSTLNDFMALGPEVWSKVRTQLQDALTDETLAEPMSRMLTPVADVTTHLPFTPADYVDFYSSEHHATNLGRLFRPDGDALMPNWKHLPVGYHGRSGSLVPSGTDIVRPQGQRRTPDGEIVFGASARLDIEAEVGFVVGVGSQLGTRVATGDFTDHVFGVTLVNDWSARDIQNWEYQPLGPFLGKSFATSIATWVTPLDALAASRVPAPEQDPAVLPYLVEPDRYAYDLTLSVEWNGTKVSSPPFAGVYWTPAQQLAHMTVNGASLRTGDFFASGTVSGPEKDQRGSFLELSWSGAEPVKLDDGSTRDFLEDGDTVTISATAPGPRGTTIGLGEVTGTIRPAN